jgi:S-layer domain
MKERNSISSLFSHLSTLAGKSGIKHTAFAMILIIVTACIATPAMAGTKYLAGNPELSASILGTNEFNPGDDTTLTLILQNSGLNEFKFVQSGIMDPEDLPNTAKLVTVALDAGNAPVVIKSDPQMVGDLRGGTSVNARFNVKFNSNAASGTYNLPVKVTYTYLSTSEQYGTDAIQYNYRQKDVTLSLPVTIRTSVIPEVVSAVPEHLNAGTEGYLTLEVKNAGSDYGTKTVLKIARNGQSPLIPTDSGVYIGDFPPGSVVTTRFKISVAGSAEAQSYPLDVYATYTSYENETVDSDKTTVGIPVGGKIDFAVVSDPAEISPGEKKVITVVYKNNGDATVYSAQARISTVDPFTSSDDTAYLGDLAPGETRDAKFEISVDSAATRKEYAIDSEIRYRDALDNSKLSDTLKVNIMVDGKEGLAAAVQNPLSIVIIVLVILGAAYLGYRKVRTKEN